MLKGELPDTPRRLVFRAAAQPSGDKSPRHRFWVVWADAIASKLAPTVDWCDLDMSVRHRSSVGASLLAMTIFNSPQACQPAA
jgi:hypothetical protein